MKTILASRAGAILVPSAPPEAVVRRADAVIVDLRSPAEYAVDHLPGAVNVPLFDDVERALVGTLYRKASPEAAFEEGRAIARAKIASLVGEIARIGGLEIGSVELARRVDELTSDGIAGLTSAIACQAADDVPAAPVVLHCWRGGLRSRSVAGLLTGIGLERVVLLEGGYKAFRAGIVREIAAWTPPRPFVLCGLTGVGKTLVLREIERRRPGWTIDLEALAGHRSSLLGMVGLEPRSQKSFETNLAGRVRELSGRTLVLEGESRKVGDVILPTQLWRAMVDGVALELTAPVERRIEVLRADYLSSAESTRQLLDQLPRVEERMKLRAGATSFADMLESGRVDELVRILLDGYYDPLYRHSARGRRYAASFDASDPVRAADDVVAWVEDTRHG